MRWMGYDHPTIMNNMYEQTMDLILQQIGDIGVLGTAISFYKNIDNVLTMGRAILPTIQS